MSTSLFRSTLIYWSGRMVARSATILLLPLVTRFIPPADWGALALLLVLGDLAALTVLCQLQVALFRAWATSPREDERARLAGAVFAAPLVLSTLLFMPAYVFAERVVALLGIDGYGHALRLLLFTQQLNVAQMVVMAEVRLRDESRRYALVELAQNIGQALLAVALVVGLGWGVWGMLAAQLCSVVATLVYLLPLFLRRAVPNLGLRRLVPLFRFAVPLVPSAVAMAGVHSIDRFILQAAEGATTLGIYSLGYKLGFAVNVLLVAPFLLVWEPKSFEIARAADAPRRVGRIVTWFVAAALFLLIGAAGAADQIVQVMAAPEYAAAAPIIPIVAASYVLFGVDAIARVGLLVSGRSRTVLSAVLAALAVKAVAGVLLVPRVGMRGAAWATFAAFATLLVLDVRLSRRFLPIAWERGRLAALVLLAGGTAVAMAAVRVEQLGWTLALKALVLLAYPVLILATGVLPLRRAAPALDGGAPAEAPLPAVEEPIP